MPRPTPIWDARIFLLDKVEEAIAEEEIAITLDPERNWKAYYYLAEAQNRLGECGHAKEAATKCLKIRRNYAPALMELGDAYACLGEEEQALGAYEKAKRDSRWRELAAYKIDSIVNKDKYR